MGRHDAVAAHKPVTVKPCDKNFNDRPVTPGKRELGFPKRISPASLWAADPALFLLVHLSRRTVMSGTIARTVPRRSRQHRRGTATVEAAIVLPVLLTLTLGTMDLCSLFFLRETVTLAAYEGARAGVGSEATNGDAIARVNEFLSQRDVETGGNAVSIAAPGFDGADTLENVTLTVTVPVSGNLLLPGSIYDGWTVSSSVTMRKEYANQD
ncbi:TadE-like protein [Crateriforma conspicua]|nr:TadE-like protein [Crateriforma conspicua]